MFNKAKINLTITYVIIAMAMSITVSFMFYNLTTTAAERVFINQSQRIERQYQLKDTRPTFKDRAPLFDINEESLKELKRNMIRTLIYINGGIGILAGTLGYFFAGRTLRPIEEMMQKQKRFISDASHELKTPLTAMKTEIEVSLRSKKQDKDDYKQILESTLEEVDSLKNLAESLLEESRYDLKEIEIKEQNLKNIINKEIKEMIPLALEKSIKIEESIEEGHIMGEKESLEKVFRIIIDNAIKYSPKNSTIKVELSSGNYKKVVRISDEGIGIENKDKEKIFDRFYRADTSRSANGFGLGLAIAKNIVEKHKGKIYVEDNYPKGSTFIVEFPSKL